MGVDPELACGIVGNIGQLWLEEQFVDLQVHVGDILFNCHRFILCACSKFFKVFFKSEVKVEAEHEIRQVTIRGISPEIFQLVLEAMYKGENGITPDNVIEVWHAAHQLQIPVLVSKCETVISSHLSQESFVNIYQNALLLQSVNVIKAAHQFVAENFESFKDSEILLQQPASSIEDIIGSDSLVGQSQNHVVEFILKWVNYELCARESEQICGGETEHVCAESKVQTLSTQAKELTLNQNGSVEVIFQKPLATLDNTTQLLGRKLSLGQLLKLVRFTEVSKESLELLADNDLVMGCKETRDIVRQALELIHLAPTSASTSVGSISTASITASPTSAASTTATIIDTEDTVVFVIENNGYTLYAYSLDRGDIFKFLTCCSNIAYIHKYDSKLLCVDRCWSSHPLTNPYELKTIEFPFSEKMHKIDNVRSDSVIVGDFFYTFTEHMCRQNVNGGDQYPLFTPAEPMTSPILEVFKNTVLYFNSGRDENGKQNIYCFDTVTRRHWHMFSHDYKDCDFVTFTHNDQLYILFGNGVFMNVTDHVIAPAKAFVMRKYSEISKSFQLWDFRLKIYGALVHHENLIIFGDLTSVVISHISNCKIPGLKTIKFVHLFGLRTKCHPLVIPKKLLTQRM